MASGISVPDDEKAPQRLKHLMPEYDAGEHKRYADRLFNAVYDEGCLNVALTGSYGCGKSSILIHFIEAAENQGHNVATISLATLQPKIIKENDSEDSLTAKLEREILGQLLYQGDPLNARESSFNRVHKTPLYHRILRALLIAAITLLLLCLVLFIADGRKDKLFAWFLFVTSHWRMVSVLLLGSLVILAFIIYWIFHFIPYGLRLGSVSAGGAALTLENNETSYFDKYRDELIYFFEVNEFDTVIFEDIDRFDDQDIFLELRNLNFTLNHAPDIVKGSRGHLCHSVSFVYAIRDSLFESLESEEDGSVVKGSGRTKVFDHIISVVPFLSKVNAYDIMANIDVIESERKRLSEKNPDEGRRFEDLLRHAAPYVADMRLMLSICNDYCIMTEEMMSSSGELAQPSDLKTTDILAMAIYKNVYPREYECLRLGKGSLNVLRNVHEETVLKTVEAFREIISLQARTIFSTSEDDVDLFACMGRELTTSILKEMPDMNVIEVKGTTYSLGAEGERGVGSARFWDAFYSLELTTKLYLAEDEGRRRRSEKAFDKRGFIKLCWPKESNLSALSPEVAEILSYYDIRSFESYINDFQGADFGKMLDEPCVTFDSDSEMCGGGTLRDVILKELEGQELACELVVSGFIKKEFDPYVSKYKKGMSTGVINFLSYYYRQGVQNIDFKLEESECREILRNIPISHFSKHSVLNYCLFRYVLGENEEKKVHSQALPMVKGCIAEFKKSGRALFDDVLLSNATTEVKNELITLATPYYDGIFDYLIESICPKINQTVGLTLIKQAFSCIGPDFTYACRFFGPWIRSHLADIDFKSIDRETDGWALRVAGLLKTADVVIDDLSNLGLYLKTACAECGIIEINRENLQSLFQTENRDTILPLNEMIIEE